MSKDKPEVGDIWEFKYKEFETKYYISAIARNPYPCFEYYYFTLYKNGNNEVASWWWDKERWDKAMMTYLGKSKANINELFEIEDKNADTTRK